LALGVINENFEITSTYHMKGNLTENYLILAGVILFQQTYPKW
jgi:hypothetical protein